MDRDRDAKRDDYNRLKHDVQYFRTYQAGDVHRVYPWISGTTFFNRVRAGRIPVRKPGRGTGTATILDFPGLVHVGVDDEMIALGARGDVADIEYQFLDDATLGQITDPPLNLDRIIARYDPYSYQIAFTVDIKHEGLLHSAMREARRQRSKRVYHVIVHPSSLELSSNVSARTIEAFSTATISVFRIYRYVLDRLGVVPPSMQEFMSQ